MIARGSDNPESVSIFYERVADEGVDTPKDAADAARAGAGEVIEVTQEPASKTEGMLFASG